MCVHAEYTILYCTLVCCLPQCIYNLWSIASHDDLIRESTISAWIMFAVVKLFAEFSVLCVCVILTKELYMAFM